MIPNIESLSRGELGLVVDTQHAVRILEAPPWKSISAPSKSQNICDRLRGICPSPRRLWYRNARYCRRYRTDCIRSNEDPFLIADEPNRIWRREMITGGGCQYLVHNTGAHPSQLCKWLHDGGRAWRSRDLVSWTCTNHNAGHWTNTLLPLSLFSLIRPRPRTLVGFHETKINSVESILFGLRRFGRQCEIPLQRLRTHDALIYNAFGSSPKSISA